MKAKMVYGVWPLKFLRIDGITLVPFVLLRQTKKELAQNMDRARRLFKHEYIHVRQVEELGWFKFYVKYLIENAKKGYWKNKYEVEAYAKQSEPLTEAEQKHFEEDFAEFLKK